MKKLLLALVPMLSLNSYAQTPSAHSDIKVSATITAGCTLTADNINFGVLAAPLTTVSASSSMVVKCSSGAPISIDIVHGNTNGSANVSSYLVASGSGGSTHAIVKDSVKVAEISCFNNGTMRFNSYVAGSLGDIVSPGYVITSDTYKLCSYGTLNTATVNQYGTPQNGSLNGVFAGEKIIYNMLLPNDNSKFWINGINSYSTTGTGADLVIPLKAQIKSSSNPTYRMTPDTYQDTVTVKLNY